MCHGGPESDGVVHKATGTRAEQRGTRRSVKQPIRLTPCRTRSFGFPKRSPAASLLPAKFARGLSRCSSIYSRRRKVFLSLSLLLTTRVSSPTETYRSSIFKLSKIHTVLNFTLEFSSPNVPAAYSLGCFGPDTTDLRG